MPERSSIAAIILKGLALPVLVVFVVLGSIYGGIASVTEASAIGVGGVILSTILRGSSHIDCCAMRRCRRYRLWA